MYLSFLGKYVLYLFKYSYYEKSYFTPPDIFVHPRRKDTERKFKTETLTNYLGSPTQSSQLTSSFLISFKVTKSFWSFLLSVINMYKLKEKYLLMSWNMYSALVKRQSLQGMKREKTATSLNRRIIMKMAFEFQ